jgi:hypothetical protein
MAGLGMLGYGLSRMAADGGLMKGYADGGEVKGYAGNEGSVTSEGFERSQLSRMNPEQLATVKHNALMRRDLELARLVDEVSAENRSMYSGLGGAFNMLAPEQQDNVVQAAGGGILAFSGKDRSDVPYETKYDEMNREANERPGGRFAIMDPDSEASRALYGPLSSISDAISGTFNRLYRTPAGDFADTTTPEAKSISAYARGQDSTDAEAINSNAKYPSKTKSAGTKTGAKTPGVTATPVATKEATFTDDMEMARKLMTNPQDAADRKALNDLISQYGTRAGELKQQAFNDFLINYGGALAQSASQPGMGTGLQGALRSAAAAAPAGAKSIMDTRTAIARAQDTNLKMQLEMRKYNIAERKNDLATMVSAAQNIRMMRHQQAQLGETIRHNQASEGLMRQRLSATGGAGLQKAYMAGMSRAQDRASREAIKLWSDPFERSKLDKAGIKSYDQLLQQRMQQHMKSAIPIYGVSAADEDDEG